MMHLAYLDAGTGSLLLQALLGGAAGMAVFWRALKDRVSQRQAARPAEEPSES